MGLPRTEAAALVSEGVKDELWRRGQLSWKLHAEQLLLYGLLLACAASRFVLEIARRFGKTWLLVVVAVETCLQNPGCRVVYGAPTLKHLEEFIIPTIEAICEDAPLDCRPVFSAKSGHFTFPNGAYIHLFGADDKRKANRGRGAGAILAIFDECGFTPILKYVLRSVLRPQLLHTFRKEGTVHGMTLLASTPAEEPDHDFTEIAERAEAQGNFASRTLFDNPLLTEEQRNRFLEDDAREEGMTVEQYMQTDEFLREWMAKRVTNKLLIVMGQDWELSREKCFKLYEELKRPDFYDAMTTLDPGGYDPHGVLFGYGHFPKGVLVIESELLLRDGENTEELQAEVKKIEQSLWGTNRWDGTLRAFTDETLLDSLPDWVRSSMDSVAPQQPYSRWCDTNIQLARDLYELHGIAFIPTAKDQKELQVNNLRVLMRAGQVAINPACVNLDRHLRGTVWKNEKRRDYKRKAGEHGDLLDCLTYKARNWNRQRNPFPVGYRFQGPEQVKAAQALQKRKAADRVMTEALLGQTPLGRKLLRGRK